MRAAAVVALLLAVVASSSGLRRVRRLPRSLWNNPKYATVDEDESKIVGGQPAQPGQIPFQVSFQGAFESHRCGATIIDEDTVLTAAHCCSVSSGVMVAGEHQLYVEGGTEQRLNVARIVIHPAYSSSTLQNDVCLVHLDGRYEYNEFVQPVMLPQQGHRPEAGSDAVVSGWGTTGSGGSVSETLLHVTVPIVGHEECNANYGGAIDEHSMICAGIVGRDSCQGDSGGPMMCGQSQCGVVSWGIGCAQDGYPGVYARTASYVEWIAANNNN